MIRNLSSPGSSRSRPARTSAPPEREPGRAGRGAGRRAIWGWSALSAALLYLAQPPAELAVLAWLAPLGWLILIGRRQPLPRAGYLILWLTGVAHWVLLLQGVRLAHWANYFGLLALAMYLACYFPAFVGVARLSLHRWKLPLVITAPVVWVGLELLRGHLLTGFSMGLLGHTQRYWPILIQIADLGGAYAVSFLVMMGSAALLSLRFPGAGPRRFVPLGVFGAVLLASCLYGQGRLSQGPGTATPSRPLRAALIQGSMDTILEYNPQRRQDAFDHYWELTTRARRQNAELDLVLWPEGAFTALVPDVQRPEGPVSVPAGLPLSAEDFLRSLQVRAEAFQEKAHVVAEALNGQEASPTHLIVGTETWRFRGPEPDQYNSAVWISPGGEIQGRYFKMHPVMFGEYVPFGEQFPWIYRLTPMSGGLTPGSEPAVFEIAGWRVAPSICFESTVPHLIRRQVQKLQDSGRTPDLLVNVTDDGWFRGSSMLDLHLACAVFRAVENRLPLLIAANTGFSAWIDGNGRIRAQGPRRQPDILSVTVEPEGRRSGYSRWGDLFAGGCLAWGTLVVLGAVRPRRRKPANEGPEGA